MYDRTGQGLIPASRLGSCLRATGRNSTEAEIAQVLSELAIQKGSIISNLIAIDLHGESSLEFNSFLDALSRIPYKDVTDEDKENFMQAFKVFDPENTGRISEGELRYGSHKCTADVSADKLGRAS